LRSRKAQDWKPNGLAKAANLSIFPLFQGQFEPRLSVFDP
jgi:hypothetical protein